MYIGGVEKEKKDENLLSWFFRRSSDAFIYVKAILAG
jgi:hypothetical protein